MAGQVVQCVLCGAVIEKRHVFSCGKCRKTPLCPSHRDPEYKFCSNCASEIRLNEISRLERGRRNLSAVLRLSEFALILSAVLFAALKLIPEHVPQFIKENVITENLYPIGGASVVLTLILRIVIAAERAKIKRLEGRISKAPIFKRGAY